MSDEMNASEPAAMFMSNLVGIVLKSISIATHDEQFGFSKLPAKTLLVMIITNLTVNLVVNSLNPSIPTKERFELVDELMDEVTILVKDMFRKLETAAADERMVN